VLIGSITPDELLARVSSDGRENLDAGVTKGRGVIMAAPHMGSWDMGGALGGALGYRVTAVAERFPGSLNDAVVRTRERFGVRVITLGRSAVRGITEALESNGVVALVCDLEQGPGVGVRFFGRSAVVPAGPAAFAIKTGASLLPSCVYADGPGRYHVHIEAPIAITHEDTKESVMQRVVARFEDFIKERPDQWFAFRPMFSR
jgi:KDO2-lipid IV(A) lauroyltransferase